MSKPTGSLNEWELSKENIQPLRQGRKFASLTAALQPHDGDVWSKIKVEKQSFEEELRTYSGDDPLDVWYRYIVWTEQTFPKGGKDGNLSTLLEKCLAQFQTMDRYKNDERYIDCWIKYADCCVDPQTIFVFMYDQNIGTEWARFYESWSWHLEQLGNIQRANSILEEGISKNAEPLENLKRHFSEFQMRVARNMMSTELPVESEEVELQRSALGHLKTSKKHSHVAVDRARTLKKGSQLGLGIGTRPLLSQTNKQQFQVFNDENQVPSLLPPQTGEWQTLPHRSVVNKENDQKPGVWTKARVPQKSGLVPFSAVGMQSQPFFSILEEENPNVDIFTPRKIPDVGNPVLSARKPAKHADPLASVRQSGICNSDEQPMYCKDKVYCGAEEYSFEELRAAKWRQKRKKEEDMKMIENEEREMEKKRFELEEQKRLLSEQTEALRLMREQLELDQALMMQEYKQQTHKRQLEIERHSISAMKEQQEILERTIDSHLEQHQDIDMTSLQGEKDTPSSSSQRESFTVKKSLFELSSKHEIGGTTHLNKEKPKAKQGPVDPKPHGIDLNTSNKTPTLKGCLKDQSLSDNSRPSNGPTPENTRRINMADPSPTVNTKEAMNLVAGMFFPLGSIDKQFGWDEDSGGIDHDPVKPPGRSGPLQFTIFDEMQEEQQPKSNKTALQEKMRMPLQQKFTLEPPESDVEMASPANQAPANKQKMEEDEDKMEGVESEARDDLTIAPVGSHLSFAAAAHIASTPFNANHSISKVKDQDNKADIQTKATQESPVSSSCQPDNFDNPDGSLRKNLSPIMEGSNEESNSHGSSAGASHVGSTYRSDTGQSLHCMQSINERDSEIQPVHVPPQVLFGSPESLHPGIDTDAPMSEDNPVTHVIDISGYTPTDVENELHQSIYINPNDPFDEESINQFLKTLDTPLSSLSNYIGVAGNMPVVSIKDMLFLGPDMYTIGKKIGKGGYAQVYSVQNLSMNDTFSDTCFQALKVQKPASKWEFYICCQIQERLSRLNCAIDMRPSMMKVDRGYFFSNGSCLVSSFCPHGSLLDFVNKMGMADSFTDKEPVCAYLTIELMLIVEHLHKCHIIHGDIKPDNFLLLQLPQLEMNRDPGVVFGGPRSLQLIDFGQGIDMTKYPESTTFMAKVKTDGFQCVEMKTNRPWTYQTDLFGLLGTIHVLVCNKYMNIYCSNGVWNSTQAFPRKWNVELWRELFSVLLNIPSCEEIPDLSRLRQKFEDYFIANLIQRYNQLCKNLWNESRIS